MAAPVVISRTPAFEHGTGGGHQLPLKGPEEPSDQTERNGANQENGARRIDYGSTPNGKHLYSTTPNGTRIVYSLEQLLTLASSPLSHQSAADVPVPDEISRSPEKRALASTATSPGGHSVSPSSTAYIAQPISPLASKQALTASTPRSFGRIANGLPRSNEHQTRSSASSAAQALAHLSTSPTSSRSPGNAFDFSKGPMGAGGSSFAAPPSTGVSTEHHGTNGTGHLGANGPPALESTPTAFKERLAAASAAAREQQRNKAGHASSNSINKESDVQFDMDI